MISLNISSDTKKEYIYRQIYKQLKKEILLHHFLPHEKLPSKRELAKTLHISVNSVNGAYQQLLEEGYIYAVERSGFYVEKLDILPPSQITSRGLDPVLAEEKESKKDWISFSHMSADRSIFPFESWLSCEHKALKLSRLELNDDSSRFPQGLYSVRQTIARFLSVARGVNCFPEQIVLGGSTQFLFYILRHLFGENTRYAMENPGYRRMYESLRMERVRLDTIPLDRKGISIDVLKRINPNVVYVTPSHQFPTGVVMPISRRIQLLNWAAETKDRYIIEDDYDSEFKYETDTIPSLQGLDSYGRVIYFGTFSKSLLPGLRLSYMILPQPLLKIYRKRCGFIMSTCNAMGQLTLQQFIDSGEYRKHIRHMKQVYINRQKKLIYALTRRFGSAMTMHGANAGLHFNAEFDTTRSVQEIAMRAKAARLELYNLQPYCLDGTDLFSRPAFILGFANLPIEKIEEGVERLYRSIF
ncbi:PLP-dependent aminotransferase family protein [Sporolactobacillus sp. CPB3-1]|uniref:PLP-dependent aminotransferase family protein n=1 Tax=Sporolactobacillus mangiferae TaxID=2940498 RepID=A0ABT0MAW6_9BACL|nr:PLP-dependent aminotransferase family protein [Sporolactobacillus mangiferae]MCL1631480.1 PLP-dependent aminotransferase family protein [Sporolactobacillus mangiferae]